MLLALETVGRSASACIIDADGRELAFRDLAPVHAEVGLVPMIEEMFAQFGRPQALALAVGPGSFTGLRIGVIAVRTLAWMEKLPVHAVDALAALAAEQGDGLWWTLVPLKRDATFAGLFSVAGGQVRTEQATQVHDDGGPIPLHADTVRAYAVGPALSTKPELPARWCPGIRLGNAAGLTARGVARLARQVPQCSWGEVLPAYHQLSGPELQRLRGTSHVGERSFDLKAPL